MSAEIIAIIGTNIVVVSVVITSMGRMESRLDAKIDAFAATVGDLARRTSHVEGVIEGLKVAVAAPRENPKRISE